MTTINVTLPTLHTDQVKAFLVKRDPRADDPMRPDRERWAKNTGRFKSIRCGRRWGKTLFGETVAEDGAIKGYPVGWFAPDYKRMIEVYNDIALALKPVTAASSKTEGVIRTVKDGRIDFWTLQDENAGRSRMYKRIIIDEGAFTDPGTMMGIWDKAIKPTLLDYSGTALVLSNTNGNDSENFFWRICNQPEHGFVEYHAPTHANPTIPRRLHNESNAEWLTRRAAELASLQTGAHPLVYQQEYLAEFIDWSGEVFFARDKLLVDGQPVPFPPICDAVFAIIDCGVKTGKENDGTGVVYCAVSKHVGHKLVVLDWDLAQIEGAMLEQWLPNVFQRLEELARLCRARMGSAGALIEDAASGQILIQQAHRRGWPATAISSKLTAQGKDQRAISVSGYHYRGEVKISQHAFDKVTNYKGTTRNHLLAQVVGFRVNDKDANRREDDLLDCYCYSVAVSLGNSGGF